MDAENTQTNSTDTQTQTGGNVQAHESGHVQEPIDYTKIESMISKGVQSKENAVLKSYFEQQGLAENEVKDAISAYKKSKAEAAMEKEKSYKAMQEENAALKAQVMENALNNKAMALALDMGVDRATAPYLVKMADLKGAVNDAGDVDESKVKTAFETVLKDVPALKNNGNTGLVMVGADGDKSHDNDTNNELRSLFGLKPKK